MISDPSGALAVPVVTLDACVLFQGRLTNLLLHLASAKSFEPVWSDEIHVEWMRNLHTTMSIPIERIQYRRNAMDRAFPVANVAALPALVSTVQGMSKTASQRKDAHVVATAVAAKANVILTYNIKDFVPHVLEHFGLAKSRPDPFCVDLLSHRPVEVLAGIRAHRRSLRRTPMSPTQYVHHLADDRMQMSTFARALARYESSI